MVASIFYMKVLAGCIAFGLLVGSAAAQSADTTTPAATISSGAKTKSSVEVSGPLVAPLKSKKVSEVPKRFFQTINPFAPVKPEAREKPAGTSTRAWSEIVGWGGAQSAFPNEATHEPRMVLVNVSKPERK